MTPLLTHWSHVFLALTHRYVTCCTAGPVEKNGPAHYDNGKANFMHNIYKAEELYSMV